MRRFFFGYEKMRELRVLQERKTETAHELESVLKVNTRFDGKNGANLQKNAGWRIFDLRK